MRTKLRREGKSNRAKRRRAWQREMVRLHAHITWCEWPEGCSETLGLAHAHSLKKTKITTREKWLEVAKLCGEHHRQLDEATGEDVHERMRDKILEIIEKRNVTIYAS